jgi:hypothetical protein
MSPGVTGVSIRAGEGISVTGWDGVATSDGRAAFLPIGALRFEAGTSSDYMDKAQRDYDHRVAALSGAKSPEHFVFVTNRRWKTKSAWQEARSAEGNFASVRVLDADDLIGWLEATPFVHLRISELLGRRPAEVESLDRWWSEFAANHHPPLTDDLFLAGRGTERDAFLDFIGAPPEVSDIAVRSGWSSDALAFAWAATRGTSEVSPPPIVLFRTSEAWNRLLPVTSPAVVVPMFPEANVGLASKYGHKVLFALGSEGKLRADSRSIDLPRVGRQEAVKALQSAGYSWEKSNRLAALFRRSTRAFIRETALDRRLATPRWTEDSGRASMLGMLALAGQWSARDADRGAVAKLAGMDWADVERVLVELSNGDDPPFVRTGDAWRLAAPVETASMLFPLLTTTDLKRWMEVVGEVMNEPDPLRPLSETDRMIAPIRGVGRRFSRELREGLATGIALMGQADALYAGGPSGEDLAEAAVAPVLTAANKDVTGTNWIDLSDTLLGIAEGAPRGFLDAIDRALDAGQLGNMFTDKPGAETSLFGPRSTHVDLLWALEIVGRSEDHFASAVDSLARLVVVDDPVGTSSARPLNSIRALVLPTDFSSTASIGQRAQFMERLGSTVPPATEWDILLALLPADRGLLMAPALPKFRDWGPESAGASAQQWEEYLDVLVGRIIEAAARDLSRWADVVDYLDELPKMSFARLTEAMKESIGATGAGDGADAERLWSELHTLIQKHREFKDAHWFMGPERLAVLDGLLATLPAPASASKFKHLFGWYPHLEGIDRDDSAAYTAALTTSRFEAVRETLADGWGALLELIDSVESPAAVAYAVSDLDDVDIQSGFFSLLDSEVPARAASAGAYATSELLRNGPEWIEKALSAAELSVASRREQFVLRLPPSERYWDALKAADGELSGYYWANMSPWGVDVDHLHKAFEMLTTAGRASAALVIVQSGLHHDPQVEFDPDVVVGTLRAFMTEKRERPPGSGSGSRIEMVLNHLTSAGVDLATIAQLEFAFYPLLRHGNYRTSALFTYLAQTPAEFVALVRNAYKATSPTEPEESVGPAVAQMSHRILNDWKVLPGSTEDGTVDEGALAGWIEAARLMLSEVGREEIGDELIGRVLASGGAFAPDGWPSKAVSGVIDRIGSRSIESGFFHGITAGRGITSRDPFAGGAQERSLAERFRVLAQESSSRRVARVLRDVADQYDREARDEDARAQWLADEG